MKRHLPLLLLLGCAGLLGLGLEQLFALRFQTGDVYPAYSTLRADPLGTMAFYESLGKIPGLSVRRDFSTANRLPEERGTVYMHLAAERYDWEWLPDDLHQEIKKFLGNGGRLVITFLPQNSSWTWNPGEDEETNAVPKSPTSLNETNLLPVKPHGKSGKLKKTGRRASHRVDLEKEWGWHFGFESLPGPENGDHAYGSVTVRNRSNPSLPASLAWHSGMIFTNCDPEWHTIYARGTNAVVMERSFGRGSVVVASDSYCLSNEALARNRHANFLAWLIGSSTRVVFDEAHLGIGEQPGIASLMRQYRLHGLAAGLLLLAGLFLWKNTTSLAPPHLEERRADFIAGKDSTSGFVNLLRRNIPPGEILNVCFAEWKKSAAAGEVSRGRQQQAEAVFAEESARPAGQRNPLATYQRISQTLSNRRPKL